MEKEIDDTLVLIVSSLIKFRAKYLKLQSKINAEKVEKLSRESILNSSSSSNPHFPKLEKLALTTFNCDYRKWLELKQL